MAESFFGVLKNERAHRATCPTPAAAAADVAQQVELRYNSQSLHPDSDTRPEHEVHQELLNRQHAT